MDGTPGQVVHRDAHCAHERPLPGVLAQVERGQHAERGHQRRHDQDHHDRAEDGREHPALGVRFPRVVVQERPDVGHVVPALGGDPHPVREVDVEDLRQGQHLLLAAVGRHHHAHALAATKLGQPSLLLLVAFLQARHLALDRLDLGAVRDPAELEPAQAQAHLLLAVVDGPDVRALDSSELGSLPGRVRQASADLVPGRRAARDHPVPLPHRGDRADEMTPLGPLDDGHVRRRLAARDLRLVDPHEVAAVQIPVGDLQLEAVGPGRPRNALAIDHGTGERLAVLQRDDAARWPARRTRSRSTR